MATNQSLIHYALDLETPPLLACDAPALGAIFSPTASEVTCPDCLSSEHFPQSMARKIRREQLRPAAADITVVPQITAAMVLREASLLLSETGENPEYDRAIVELTSALIGAGQDDSILVTRILRSLAERN